MDLEQIQKILELLKEYDVSEIEYEDGDMSLSLKLGTEQQVPNITPQAVPQQALQPIIQQAVNNNADITAAQNAEVDSPENDVIPEENIIRSPVVGVFYATPAPDADPFVEEGSEVEEEDVLCIIEAMKLMNEVPAPRAGRIKKVLVSSGQKVEFGQELMILE